jgi:hypothetical protein
MNRAATPETNHGKAQNTDNNATVMNSERKVNLMGMGPF